MSSQALENLKILFQDCPEVLRMLDLRELDQSNLTDQQLREEMKKRKLYPEPINFYATGRTGAGKTSLGNSLLGSGIMESTGRQDCTSGIQYFAMASNLRYFDLPGGGSNEEFENINRVALLIPQLEDEKEVNEFIVFDFSDHAATGQVSSQKVTVTEWQSVENQKYVSPDLILYVLAPHGQFLREDKKYLRALLKSQKARRGENRVIFALNIHRNRDGSLKPTPQNIEDARKGITEVYQEIYSGTPPIVKIDSLRGEGINQITELICEILPPEKIGNMRQVLREELKQFAEAERSRRYREALIYIASRLATYTVDTQFGNQSLLKEAYAAICSYGIKIFREEDVIAQAEKELADEVSKVAEESKQKRQKVITEKENITERREEKQTKITSVPEYDWEKITDTETDYIEIEQTRLVTDSIRRKNPVARFLFGEYKKQEVLKNETIMKPIKRTVERLEKRLVGMREEREEIGTGKYYDVVVGQRDKEVGKKALQGGYDVIEDLLAIGLGIELADAQKDLRTCFETIVKSGRVQVQMMISRYKEQINQLVESSPPDQAEDVIIRILEKVLIS
ncbi:GTPase [Aerosakkonema funiforme]|uniref:GTPase n=1 Tax=Aerosakkonema funiforme TaxID=1246630 RepID=UPI0035BAF6AC